MIAQWLRVLAPSEDLDVIPSVHMSAHNQL